MYLKKEYRAYPVRGVEEESHTVEVSLDLKVISAATQKARECYESHKNIHFYGVGNTKSGAIKEITDFLLKAKEDIETAIKEVKSI